MPAARSAEICRRANESGQRAGRDDSGRTQINQRVAVAHAAFEIAIRRADRDFAFLHQTASQADARAATGRQRNRAGIHQSLPIAVRFRSGLHFGAGRSEIKFDTVGHASAPRAHHFCRVVQILEARVHARQQIRFLNRHLFPLHFRQRHHRLHFVRPGDVRNDSREIELQLDGVFGVGVGAEFGSILPPLVDIGVRVTGATLRTARSRVALDC